MNTVITDRFVDNLIIFYKFIPLRKLNMEALHILLYMFRQGNEKYPDLMHFRQKMMQLYDARINWGFSGYGDHLFLYCQLSYIARRYLEDKNYIQELIELMEQVLDHPVLSKESFEKARILYLNRLDAQSENPDFLAMQSALKLIDPAHPLSFNLQGDREKAEAVTYEQVMDLYHELEKISYKAAYGGLIEEQMAEFIQSRHHPSSTDSMLTALDQDGFKSSALQMEFSQSSLFQIYRSGEIFGSQRFYALMVANALLGNSQNSLLFEEVREKHSFCYGISSSLIWMDGAIFIKGQILPEAMEEALELIEKQVMRVKEGDFTYQQFERAKRDLINSFRLKKDSLADLLETKIRFEFLKTDIGLDDLIRSLENVSFDQIPEAFENVTLVAQGIVEAVEDLNETSE